MVTMDMILEWQKIEIEKIMMVLDNIFYVYKNNFSTHNTIKYIIYSVLMWNYLDWLIGEHENTNVFIYACVFIY